MVVILKILFWPINSDNINKVAKRVHDYYRLGPIFIAELT